MLLPLHIGLLRIGCITRKCFRSSRILKNSHNSLFRLKSRISLALGAALLCNFGRFFGIFDRFGYKESLQGINCFEEAHFLG